MRKGGKANGKRGDKERRGTGGVFSAHFFSRDTSYERQENMFMI